MDTKPTIPIHKQEFYNKEKSLFLLWICLLINLIFFFLVLFITHPIYNSDDDAFLAYQLAGGFGKAPSGILIFNYGMHPLIGFAIKSMFTWMDKVNWYTVFLYLCHFVASCIILFQFLKHIDLKFRLGIYAILFIVFECRFLLQPTFTNTAILLGIAGLVLVISSLRGLELKRSQLITGCLVLIFAALIRVHVLLPLLGITLPFILFSKRIRAILICFLYLILTFGLIFLLNSFQKIYYKTRIGGWEKDEKYRQAFFHYINHPRISNDSIHLSTWSTENDLAKNGLLIDKAFITEKKLYAMSDQNGLRTIGSFINNKWLYLENRIYFFALLVIGLYARFDRSDRLAFWTSVALCILGVLYLSIYKKLPQYLFPALSFYLGILMILYSRSHKVPLKIKIVRIVCLLFIGIWALIRLYKINSNNKENNEYFKSAYQELITHNKILFLVTDDEFPLDNFYVWDTPKKYMIENLLYKENLLVNDYDFILKSFQIQNLKQLPEKTNVLLWGKRSFGLEQYYQTISGHRIIMSGPLKEFKHEVHAFQSADTSGIPLQSQ